MYRIIDRQLNCYFADGEVFPKLKDVFYRLASYHSADYEGEKSEGVPYADIWEFLATLKSLQEKINWLLEWGEWEIEEVAKNEVLKSTERALK